ncbi:MAG TPA: gamma-glutamyltransferase family protein [Phenylobacterium sp.]|uniref:gamma-glutamyltransferase family protein n=1 Tax=Phenylobacterium sp. TaxID=1871053 RepID=UPI002D6FB7C1|nr:gamma-glutamyltransferase family protein [Phenylobacterium sp.]HZZ67290.1 gamma-glutamyltransferase family protein [Phenylobacterium sp.]
MTKTTTAWRRGSAALALGVAITLGGSVLAQTGSSPLFSTCEKDAATPACNAIRGDRAEGWPAQSRAEVFAQHGMVTTSQPLAAQAGLQILKNGGNAIDAAVATAAVLNVVEPMNVGVGGDLFAIVYVAKEHKLYALNASGMAPTGATPEHFASLGYHADPKNWGPSSGMPSGGILTVTAPGSVWGWEAILKRFGTMGFKQVLAPAESYAQGGFPVSQRIAHDWRLPKALPLKGCCTSVDPDSVAAWYIDGKPPVAGQIYRNPDLAKTFRLLQAGGAQAFYHGEIAKALVAKSTALGGTMTLDDLANYHGEWVEPVHTSYHGHEVYELPPPSQDWAALEMINVLEQCVPVWTPGQTLASLGPRSAEYWHLMVEAKKLAYADLIRFNADPNFVKVPIDELLSKAHARSLCGKVDPRHASATGPAGEASGLGDTIVLSTADDQGNMVAWVNSNYSGFGSGITVPGYGFILHNRGGLFSLDPKSPNVIAPHKRPYNTLAAGFVMDGSNPLMTLLLMGGDMQAQGHAQALVNIFDLGANLQMATDMARFRHSQVPNRLVLEQPLYDAVGKDLAAMGHKLGPADSAAMGGFQAIAVSHPEDKARRVYRAGSDHRKDGQAVGW